MATLDDTGTEVCRECRGKHPTLTHDSEGKLVTRVCGTCGSGSDTSTDSAPLGIGRGACKNCGYNGWTWLFARIRLCRGCARDRGYSDPLKRGFR